MPQKSKTELQAQTIILYGTKTGHSKFIAEKAKKKFEKNNILVKIADMKDFKPKQLSNFQNAFFIISTHGKGQPPDSALKFFKKLSHPKMEELNNLNYSICALGDSSYKHFCEAGKNLNEKMKNLKANPILPMFECDVDYKKEAKSWIKAGLKILEAQKGGETEANISK